MQYYSARGSWLCWLADRRPLAVSKSLHGATEANKTALASAHAQNDGGRRHSLATIVGHCFVCPPPLNPAVIWFPGRVNWKLEAIN